MADPNRIHIVLESLPGARAQVSINIATPWPGMRVDTPAHSLAIDVLGWLGKQPEVAGFVYSPSNVASTPEAYRAEKHHAECYDEACPGCLKQAAHIVLDLETLSTQPDAAVASIGAVALTGHGGFVSEFHVAVDTGAPQHLRHACPNTLAWWDKQSDAAKAASIQAADTLLPYQALHAFTAWVEGIADPKKVKVWGNGSSFDNVILSSLYADYPEKVRPWAYWNDRDMRTVLDLYPQAKDVGEFEGVKHNALHDARHEAKQLAGALRLAAGAATPPAHTQSDELEATRDMLDTARTDMNLLREALDVPVEPHQSLQERMLEAALLGFGAQREWLQPGDMEALQRFEETTSDDQSYDIGKEAVKRLAHFGCLESHGFGRYGITAFGSYVLGDWARARELPFKTQADRDAEQRAAIAARATQGAAA